MFDPRDMGYPNYPPNSYANYHTGSLKRRSLAAMAASGGQRSMFHPRDGDPYAAPRANPAPYPRPDGGMGAGRDAKLLNQLGRMSPEEQLDKFLRSVAANAGNQCNVREDTEFDDYAIVQKPAKQATQPPLQSGQNSGPNGASSGWRSMDSLGQDPRRYSMIRRKV